MSELADVAIEYFTANSLDGDGTGGSLTMKVTDLLTEFREAIEYASTSTTAGSTLAQRMEDIMGELDSITTETSYSTAEVIGALSALGTTIGLALRSLRRDTHAVNTDTNPHEPWPVVRMIEGRLYRLTRPLGGGGWPDLPAGTVFTYRGTVDHFDWFQCLVEPVGGPVQGIGYGLPDYCEEVETD